MNKTRIQTTEHNFLQIDQRQSFGYGVGEVATIDSRCLLSSIPVSEAWYFKKKKRVRLLTRFCVLFDIDFANRRRHL
jgi:hypothetical protein